MIAAAGGVVLAPANRAALRERAGAGRVAAGRRRRCWSARALRQDHRPLLDDDPAATLARLAADREAAVRRGRRRRSIDIDRPLDAAEQVGRRRVLAP